MTTQTIETKQNPGCLLQILWFAFIGFWLGQLWMVAAWILMVTIIGIPLGVTMLNSLPKVFALREPPRKLKIAASADGSRVLREVEPEQVNIFLRAIYFVFIGWWFSALWMEAAYAMCMSVIGLPLGFWMFDATPAVVSLRRD
jgi:uncharacterized membrane protein YccF (DUF307 family)